jgi:catechol 2,3-dioxygenase-like lactoylglutathione lyase family enzyme
VITAVHTVINARDAEAARAFFRDTLNLPFTDAGHGWLIFALPPGELGIHPTACGELSLYQPRHASPLKP